MSCVKATRICLLTRGDGRAGAAALLSKTDKEKPRQKICRGFFQGRYGRGLATESNTVSDFVDHVTVQTNV